MRVLITLCVIMVFSAITASAQRACATVNYQQEELRINPSLADRQNKIEAFVQQQLHKEYTTAGEHGDGVAIIKIPVVVHILYHEAGENVSDQQVYAQIKSLNDCYRRRQPDSANTPAVFKPLAADCGIEFQLATSDPTGHATTGIVRKYTPIARWAADDLIKYSANMGDDAWNAGSYLNIWVCNMRGVAGFSSVVGGPADKDGVVLDCSAFGLTSKVGYEMGKTGVHEVGHWLGLRHIWGDEDCGDDGISDTPKQSTYSVGCPTGTRITCGNSPTGNMYMNYMDFTSDLCTNLFTKGQRERMRSLFANGGVRNSLLSSTGLNAPLYHDAPIGDASPRWLHPQLYPNPVSSALTVDISYDTRWIGKVLTVINSQGLVMMQVTIASRIQQIDISRLVPGAYFISGKKDDGETIRQKIVKL